MTQTYDFWGDFIEAISKFIPNEPHDDFDDDDFEDDAPLFPGADGDRDEQDADIQDETIKDAE